MLVSLSENLGGGIKQKFINEVLNRKRFFYRVYQGMKTKAFFALSFSNIIFDNITLK